MKRRIRQLLGDGRIEGVVKVGSAWNIPKDAIKPTDKRVIRPDNNEFIINLDDNYFDEVDNLKKELDSKRPITKETLKTLKESINLEWTYNSNGIEGNTLTLREKQVALEGITVGGKTITEHLEAINQEKAILYLDDLVKDKQPITERNIVNSNQFEYCKEICFCNEVVYDKEKFEKYFFSKGGLQNAIKNKYEPVISKLEKLNNIFDEVFQNETQMAIFSYKMKIGIKRDNLSNKK